jgi:hypothetical protein
MRTNSGSGESKNNNHDPTLRDRETSVERSKRTNEGAHTAPADNRGARK